MRTALLLLLLLGAPAALAQRLPDADALPGSGREAPSLRFEHLTMEDGLSSNYVLSLYQDRKGFLWIGTDFGGLNRYDGYSFTVFQHDPRDPGTLSDNSVNSIMEDRDGVRSCDARP